VYGDVRIANHRDVVVAPGKQQPQINTDAAVTAIFQGHLFVLHQSVPQGDAFHAYVEPEFLEKLRGQRERKKPIPGC